MTKAGSDHLKRQAREIARESGRRLPDVLAELRRAPRAVPPRQPSKELVARCNGLAHPIDGGRCAREAGHPGHWSWCSPEPHLASHVWQGYVDARSAAEAAEHEAWLAGLSPAQRADWEAEQKAAYEADMAYEGYDPADDNYGKDLEYVLDAQDEARWAAEAEEDGYDAADPYEVAYLEAR
ncbi:hypothetical protein PV516_19680 [Streptomyces scabiei]|uniref:hypothetical protein n=1 Tax=Streptomyces scabiei TaxID=1930 RepID=UPI0029AF8B13|nr:hypothetical protein [Streptomyces scabiei]MDX3166012.1 hypothetical protein [Streptomyces scabiei]